MESTPHTFSQWPWRLKLWRRHLWHNERAAWHAVSDALAKRLADQTAASEQHHSGQARICVEGALPVSYLWRSHHAAALDKVVRQRALAWFGRLRIWDTEHNNGVLIYLLLAERRIEIVADRGLARQVDPAHWQTVTQTLAASLRQGDFETGLTQALEAVTASLVEHFPLPPGQASVNELPDAVVRV